MSAVPAEGFASHLTPNSMTDSATLTTELEYDMACVRGLQSGGSPDVHQSGHADLGTLSAATQRVRLCRWPHCPPAGAVAVACSRRLGADRGQGVWGQWRGASAGVAAGG